MSATEGRTGRFGLAVAGEGAHTPGTACTARSGPLLPVALGWPVWAAPARRAITPPS